MSNEKMMKLGEKGKYQKLEKFTADKSAATRADAYEALGLIHNPESILLLNSGLRDESPEVRLAAANSLKNVGTVNMVEALRLQATKETDSAVKKAIEEAMAAIKSRT